MNPSKPTLNLNQSNNQLANRMPRSKNLNRFSKTKKIAN